MWRVYGNRGYAIMSTVERLSGAFAGYAGEIDGGKVEYANFSIDEPLLGNAFNLVTTKDLPYRDEREFRLLYSDWASGPIPAPRPAGIRIPVEVNRLIERLYVNPTIRRPSDEVHELLKSRRCPYWSSAVVEASPLAEA